MINEAKSHKGYIIGGIVILLLIVLTVGITITGNVIRSDKVELRVNFLIDGEHAPYYLGLEKGFYAEEGIDLQINPGKGSSLAVQLVGTGEETFGLASSEIVLKGKTNGIPVTSVAVVNPRSPVTIISLKEKEILDPEDLYGRTLGVNYKSNTYQQYRALVKTAELDDSKITEVPGAATLDNLLSGRVDAILRQTHNEPVTLISNGYEINELLFEDHGIHFYGITIIASDETIRGNPELVRGFIRATEKAWQYSLENPGEAAEALTKHNPELDTDITQGQFLKFASLVDTEGMEKGDFGQMTFEEWDNTQETLFELGLIEKRVDVNTVFTNKFL
jgi:NitT/TauT family transport system substrate-binding protein